jgi:flavin reductase (DIM6/NTAB) family NADH-FMN oxidoreductase RutF
VAKVRAELRREMAADQSPARTDQPVVDDAVFLEVMASFAASVAVVSAIDERGEPRGLTTTAVASVSREPPLLLVCIDRSSRTLPAIRHSSHFAVSFLAQPHTEVALLFSSKVDDKFAEIDWTAGVSGSPVLHEHSHAWVDCRVSQEIEAGDHVILIAEVADAGVVEQHGGQPLAYFGRSFGQFVPSRS